ncbi:MAG: hypothetical protein ACYCPH_01445 [Minisyncoccota bacterium]
MNANKNVQPEVSSGPYAAIRAMNQEVVQKFFKGESDDPAQIIERLEERAEYEEEE